MFKNKKIIIILTVIGALFFYGQIASAELIAPATEAPANTNNSDQTVTNEANTNINTDITALPEITAVAELNLTEYPNTYYAGGDNIVANGHFFNDVIIAGNNVTIDGIVDGDVIAAGANIIINAEIRGNIRAAGNSVTINGTVKKNTTIFAGQIMINATANLERDLTAFGGILDIYSPVAGKVYANAGQISINNILANDVDLNESSQLSIGAAGKILGNLEYQATADQALTNMEDKVEGQVIRQEPSAEKKNAAEKNILSKYTTASFWLWSIIKLLSLLLTGLIFVNIFKDKTTAAVTQMHCCPGKNLLRGIIISICAPFLCFIAMLTVIGLPLGLISLLAYGITIYLAMIIAGTAMGKAILPNTKSLVGPAFLGIIILWLIKLIPFVGGVAFCLAILMAIGAFLRNKIATPAPSVKPETEIKKPISKTIKKIKVTKNSRIKKNGKK